LPAKAVSVAIPDRGSSVSEVPIRTRLADARSVEKTRVPVSALMERDPFKAMGFPRRICGRCSVP